MDAVGGGGGIGWWDEGAVLEGEEKGEVEVQGMEGRLGGVRAWLGWSRGVIGCGYGHGR